MCGRYQFTAEQCAEIQQIVQTVQEKCGSAAYTPGDVYPSGTAPVLLNQNGNIIPDLLKWGFPAHTLIINARAETVAEKPLFRDSLRLHRCVIPSSGFCEWTPDKRKYFFHLPDHQAIYMPGIFAAFDGTQHYCILTTQANDSVQKIHPRMPLVLQPGNISTWILDPSSYLQILKKKPPQLISVAVDGQIKLW